MYRVADIKDIEFWPMWASTERSIGVEPDVFISLELGDPVRKIHVILEAKHGGGFQNEWQWRSEIHAWFEGISAEEREIPDQLIFLAVGGLIEIPKRSAFREKFLRDIRVEFPSLPELLIAMISWDDLARACEMTNPSERHQFRIVRDMQLGLELFGFFHRVTPTQLESLQPLKDPLSSLSGLMNASALFSKQV